MSIAMIAANKSDFKSQVQNHHLLSTQSGKLYVAGLGNSLLAAAALATARDTCSLRKASVETIPIAFRLALAIQQRGIHIEPGHGNWTRTVSAVNKEQITQLIHDREIEVIPTKTPTMKERPANLGREHPLRGTSTLLRKHRTASLSAARLLIWPIFVHPCRMP